MITKPRWGAENCGDIPNAIFSWEIYCGNLHWVAGLGFEIIVMGNEPVYDLEKQLDRIRTQILLDVATEYATRKLTT